MAQLYDIALTVSDEFFADWGQATARPDVVREIKRSVVRLATEQAKAKGVMPLTAWVRQVTHDEQAGQTTFAVIILAKDEPNQNK